MQGDVVCDASRHLTSELTWSLFMAQIIGLYLLINMSIMTQVQVLYMIMMSSELTYGAPKFNVTVPHLLLLMLLLLFGREISVSTY